MQRVLNVFDRLIVGILRGLDSFGVVLDQRLYVLDRGVVVIDQLDRSLQLAVLELGLGNLGKRGRMRSQELE